MDAAPALCAPDTVSANLRTILRGLLAALGGWGLEAGLALLLYRRIAPVAGRIERMLMRLRAGRLWRVTQRGAVKGRQARRRPDFALPRRLGWLVQVGGHRAACFGAQLQHVLNAPEMTALLTASPQAVRLLRPLCRALAVELPETVAAPRRPASDSRAAPTRRRRTSSVPEPFRVPLPRGVLAAARREGFGKDRQGGRGEAP